MFWRNSEFLDDKTIVSKVLGVTVTLSSDIIAKATKCHYEGYTYYEGQEKAYDSYISRAIYNENVEKVGEQKTIVYNLPCERLRYG